MPTTIPSGITSYSQFIGLYTITPNSTYINTTSLKCMLLRDNTVQFISRLATKSRTTIPAGSLLFTLPTELCPYVQTGINIVLYHDTSGGIYSILPLTIGTNGQVRNRAEINSAATSNCTLYLDGQGFNISSKYYH